MIRFFVTHETAGNLLMVLLLVAGLVTLPKLRRETLPDYTPNEVEVVVVYPGATAEDVEEAICRRIEDAVDGVLSVYEVRSDATEGRGRVVVEMTEGGDFQKLTSDVRTEVDAIDDFPETAEEPVVRQLGQSDPVVSIAVTGPMSVPHLKAYLEELKRRLERRPGVSLVAVKGFSEHQLRIELSAQSLRQYNVSADRVAATVGRQSLDLPLGRIESRDQDVVLRFADERRSPRELGDLVMVGSDSGAEIRLGDIARIVDEFELDEEKILFNGARAGLLAVEMTKSEDSLKVMAEVRAFLEEEEASKPPGVEFHLTEDVSSIVEDRLTLLVKNGLQGLLLVFLTLWLFFSFRFSFWVTMGLPVAFLGALALLPFLGVSINMLSMVALLLAIGLLMDDALVIAENVASHLARGKSAVEAAIDGVTEVRRGVLSSFITTICVFGPISFLAGDIGTVIRVVPVVLILVLAVSLIEAFLILPHHLAHSLKSYDPARRGRFRRGFESAIDFVRDRVLGPTVALLLRWRYLTAGVVIAVFLTAIGLVAGGRVKFQAFPDLDGDVILCRILLPPGTPLERTEAIVDRITGALDRVVEAFPDATATGEPLIRNVMIRFSENLDANETGPHLATVSVDLAPAERRGVAVHAVLDRWRREVGALPDVFQLAFAEPSFGPAGRPIEIRIHGDDLTELARASREVQEYLSQFPGVLDLTDDLRPGKPEIRFRLAAGAQTLGLDAAELADQLRTAFSGRTAREIQVGTESYEVEVRFSDADRDSLADLDGFYVTLEDGAQVPLDVVAERESSRGWSRIALVDGVRTVTVQGDVDTPGSNTAEILAALQAERLPEVLAAHPGVEISFEGEVKESQITGASLRGGLLIGLLGVFAVLSFQFRSYVDPIVVMLAIPFAFIGVVFGHMLRGIPLSMPGLMGFASLAGVVVNDSILLIDFLKKRRAEGIGIDEAAAYASRARFRAILLTSLTTIAGLLPLFFEQSLQAQVLKPLATSVIFGLLASTVLVLFVIPVAYAILHDLGRRH